jgi:hypothetical protein
MFAMRQEKRTANYFFVKCFLHRASWKSRTAKLLFVVRPENYARQTFERTANGEFPTVKGN